MKVLLLSLFVAVVSAAPLPEEDGGPVELIVNGVPDGEPLELGEIVDIKLKEHGNGEVVATNLLHPYTAIGIAEAAAAAAAEESFVPEPGALPEPVAPEVILPDPVVLPQPVLPEVVPEPVVLPEPVLPEVVSPANVIPESIVMPQPVEPEVVSPEIILPEPIILPEAVNPEVVKPVAVPETVEAEAVPSPALQDNEVFNDGVVSVTVNGPEANMLSTLQSWFRLVLNYFKDGTQTTHEIV